MIRYKFDSYEARVYDNGGENYIQITRMGDYIRGFLSKEIDDFVFVYDGNSCSEYTPEFPSDGRWFMMQYTKTTWHRIARDMFDWTLKRLNG